MSRGPLPRLAAAALLLLAAACTPAITEGTPRQAALALMLSYEPVQVVAEAVVAEPQVPAEVKTYVRGADAAIVGGLESCVEGARAGIDSTALACFSNVNLAVQRLAVFLAGRGYLEEGDLP